MGWTGWVAALGGALTFIGAIGVSALASLNWLWGLVAVVFGVWAAME